MVGEEERNILYKGVKTFPSQTRFKNLEGKSGSESLKRTILASGGLGLLHFKSLVDVQYGKPHPCIVLTAHIYSSIVLSAHIYSNFESSVQGPMCLDGVGYPSNSILLASIIILV